MGQQVPGTREIKYKTKDGIPISYIFYDLKGKNRFPTEPSNQAKVNALFQMTLGEIDGRPDQIAQLKGFNTKYRHRFTIMHKRKLQQANQRSSLSLGVTTTNLILQHASSLQAENKSQTKKLKLQQKLKQIVSSKSSLKIAMSSLQKLINQNKAHTQFVQINGVIRLLGVLQKQIKANLQGYKTNFSNQIDILRFFKSFSTQHVRQFYNNIQDCQELSDYGNILMDAFHPICTPVTAYCLTLLEDYIWRTQQSKDIYTILRQYAKKEKYSSFLSVFTQTLQSTNNILLVFYIVKFINQVMAGTVEEAERAILRKQLAQIKYQQTVQSIKLRLQQNFYKVQACTFMIVSQQIFKYASKGKKQYQSSINNPQATGSTATRTTLNMKDLQQQLVMNFFEMVTKQSDTHENKNQTENEQQLMTVYLSQSSNKQFNKFILDVVSQIRSYYKLQTFLNANVQSQQFSTQSFDDEQKQKLFVETKLDDLKQQQYLKYIRANCVKNDCTTQMLNIMRNLQYFQKGQLRKLQNWVVQEMGGKKVNGQQIQVLKKTLKEKQDLVKKLLKQNVDLKSQAATKNKNNQAHDTGHEKSILPPPPSLGSTTLPPPPSLGSLNLPPPPSLSSLNLTLPPPPSLPLGTTSSQSNQQQKNQNNSTFLLPPPPPPPPSLSSTLSGTGGSGFPNLPSLPPPPPSLNDTLSSLPPPPPSLSSTLGSLPPPPSLGDIGILPPPPSLSTLGSLPPPPSLSALGYLPPPPSLSGLGGLPPPPSLSGLGSLPTLPSLGGLPTLGLPTLPGLSPMVSNEKTKQKRKPKVPLKNCNYAVLSHDKIIGTIWQQVNDQKVSLDQSQLQSLFSKKVDPPKQLKVQSLIKVQSQQKKQPVKLIPPQRWRNIQIVLMKLKVPKGQLYKNLVQCTGKYCSPSILQSIKNILPTQDQQQLIKMYSGDPNQLGRPQQFYRQLITVPQYAHRIKSMIFASHKDDSYAQIQTRIQQLTQGFKSLKDNYRFHHILQVALAVGNYLNGTSLKGGAWGFKVESIQRLEEVKSADSKMNAAYFVIKEVWKKYQYPMFSKQQLDMYSFLSKMPVSQISSDIGQLRKTLSSIKKSQKSQIPNNQSDNIGKFCQQMRTELQMKVQLFTDMVKQLEQAYSVCAAFYCQDSKKQQSDQFGKKVFKSIFFIFQSQRVYKVVQDKNKKQQQRKAVKSQIVFVQNKEEVKNPQKKSDTISKNGLPEPPKIVVPQEPSKQQKLKQYEKAQKKAHQDMLKKRQTKVIAYRNSKLPKPPLGMNAKNQFDDISFLKGVK